MFSVRWNATSSSFGSGWTGCRPFQIIFVNSNFTAISKTQANKIFKISKKVATLRSRGSPSWNAKKLAGTRRHSRVPEKGPGHHYREEKCVCTFFLPFFVLLNFSRDKKLSNCESLQTSSKNVASTTTTTRLAEIMKICFDIRQRDGAAAVMEGTRRDCNQLPQLG